MAVLASCIVAHLLLAQVISSPWWVPDVTLAGLIVAVMRAPSRWLLWSLVAGGSMLLWVLRHAVPILGGALAVGAAAQLLARDWEAADVRLQYLMVGLSSGLLTAGAIWLDGCWSLPLLGLAAVRVTLTCLAFALVRRLPVVGGAR